MTKHFSGRDFKPLPEPAKAEPPFIHWTVNHHVELRGLPGGFIDEDQLSAAFDAFAFIDEIPVALGRFYTRREAALAIASVHNGG